MGFKCGIIGLPNVGKSTIFNALTAQQAPASNYPFCTVEPNHGIVHLDDPRLKEIQNIIGSARRVPTVLEFVDIAGLVKGASKGEGLGNQFLSHIQQVDAIGHVVRCFEDPNISHTDPQLDAVRDAEIVNLELILKDLEIVTKRMHSLRQKAQTGDKQSKTEIEQLQFFAGILNQERMICQADLSPEQQEISQSFNLLTAKPMMYIANVDEIHLQDNPYAQKLKLFAEQQRAAYVQLCGKAQEEISQLEPENQKLFLEEFGLDELGLQKIVRTGYQLLHLVTFFTANENEAHAWTIKRGTDVQKAAGKIHSDFEQGFIRAEVMTYSDLITYGSEQVLKEKGLVATQGRDYIVEDGDVIFYRFK